MSIELRFSDIPPPTPEPPRTIYRDLLDLPDPTKLGVTIRYYNFDSVSLYFQITAACAGYTFGTVNLGALGAGANAYINLDEFGSRAKPASETTETIVFTLKAYTDAGYSNLKWTYERSVDVVWIKSNDPSYTVDVLNNFDDGTVQGWAVSDEFGNQATFPKIAVATDYVLSVPNSCKMTSQRLQTSVGECRSRLYKSFNTPDKNYVYAIINVRTAFYNAAYEKTKYLAIQRDGTTFVFIGRPYDTVLTDYFPQNKWMRIVIPLPRNATIDVRIVLDFYCNTTALGSPANDVFLWIDDFKIISKD